MVKFGFTPTNISKKNQRCKLFLSFRSLFLEGLLTLFFSTTLLLKLVSSLNFQLFEQPTRNRHLQNFQSKNFTCLLKFKNTCNNIKNNLNDKSPIIKNDKKQFWWFYYQNCSNHLRELIYHKFPLLTKKSQCDEKIRHNDFSTLACLYDQDAAMTTTMIEYRHTVMHKLKSCQRRSNRKWKTRSTINSGSSDQQSDCLPDHEINKKRAQWSTRKHACGDTTTSQQESTVTSSKFFMSEHKRRIQIVDAIVVINDSVLHCAIRSREGFDLQQK